MTYVVLDEQGTITGSYPDGVWNEDTRPAAAQEVSQAAWEHLLNGGRYVDGQMLAPAPPAFDVLQTSKHREITAAFEQAVSGITSVYPLAERETFTIQEAEARAYVADNNASVPFIATLATEEGMTVADKAAEIIVKADLFRASMALAVGRRHKLKNQIDAATSEAQLAAIVWAPSS